MDSFDFTPTSPGMTSTDKAAAPLDPTAVEPKGGSFRRLLVPFAIALALLLAFLTFAVLTGLTRIAPTREVAVSFILMNGATILVLLGIIFREVLRLTQARRSGRAAARLHIQIVSLFSIMAVLPAVLVAIGANVTIER